MYHQTFARPETNESEPTIWHRSDIDMGLPFSQLSMNARHDLAQKSIFMPTLKYDLQPHEPLLYPGGERKRTLHLPLKKDYHYGSLPERHHALGIVLFDAPESHYPMIGEIKNADGRQGPAQRMNLQSGMLLVSIEGSSTYDIGHEKATEWLQARVHSLTKLCPDGKTHKHKTDYVVIGIDAYKCHEYFYGGVHKAYEFYKMNQERDVAFAKAGLTPEPLAELYSQESHENQKWQYKEAIEQPVQFVLDEKAEAAKTTEKVKPSFADVVKQGAQTTTPPVAIGKVVDSDDDCSVPVAKVTVLPPGSVWPEVQSCQRSYFGDYSNRGKSKIVPRTMCVFCTAATMQNEARYNNNHSSYGRPNTVLDTKTPFPSPADCAGSGMNLSAAEYGVTNACSPCFGRNPELLLQQSNFEYVKHVYEHERLVTARERKMEEKEAIYYSEPAIALMEILRQAPNRLEGIEYTRMKAHGDPDYDHITWADCRVEEDRMNHGVEWAKTALRECAQWCDSIAARIRHYESTGVDPAIPEPPEPKAQSNRLARMAVAGTAALARRTKETLTRAFPPKPKKESPYPSHGDTSLKYTTSRQNEHNGDHWLPPFRLQGDPAPEEYDDY